MANLERFVTGNLAGGIDHLVVFVDDDDSRLMDFLSAHPHTTGIAATTWWGPNRPGALNSRQRIAANAVRAIATALGDVDWIFHIDGDEVVQLDPRRLSSLPSVVPAVRLQVLESVGVWDPDPSTAVLFKRRLKKADLELLVQRGVIDRPRNDHYFHGHVNGKIGLRPSLDIWLGIHRAMNAKRDSVEAYEASWLRLLHYESPSGPEFVRKWRNLLNSGTRAAVRTPRGPVEQSLRASLERGDADSDDLRRIFEESTADDVNTLLRLGLLEEMHPLSLGHIPEEYSAKGELLHLLEALTPEDKRVFEPGRDEAEVRTVLERGVVRAGYV